jgi:hypothetical protein
MPRMCTLSAGAGACKWDAREGGAVVMPRMRTLSAGAGACEGGASSQRHTPTARHVIDSHLLLTLRFSIDGEECLLKGGVGVGV